MALIHPFETTHGVVCEEAYHKLAQLRLYGAGELIVHMNVYANRRAYETGKEPFLKSLSIERVPIAKDGEDLLSLIYRTIKGLPEYHNCKDA